MPTVDITIQHAEGMHARPASIFVREAARFKSEIRLSAGGTTVNGKSIMGLLMLALSAGTVVTLEAEGPDADAACATLSEILAGNFE
ncbi:MAG: HPr family phosphocarrier protein [Leptospiraceae bacterium]|nr:HPr family phosphocarrier protein [Leptospiraceae bacterium]